MSYNTDHFGDRLDYNVVRVVLEHNRSCSQNDTGENGGQELQSRFFNLLIMHVKSGIHNESITELIQVLLDTFTRGVANKLHFTDSVLALGVLRYYKATTVLTLSPV